jgi:hypothetical protein
MVDSAYGIGTEPLTMFERARLRPTVRVVALEAWLAATGGDGRRAVIAHFAQEVTPDDLRAAHVELGGTAAELAELEGILAEPLPSVEPLHTPGPGAPPGALAFVPIPYEQFLLQLAPPDEPSLRSLWEAIEPSVIS